MWSLKQQLLAYNAFQVCVFLKWQLNVKLDAHFASRTYNWMRGSSKNFELPFAEQEKRNNIFHCNGQIKFCTICKASALKKKEPKSLNGNGLLFHMTQSTSRSTIKPIGCSKPTARVVFPRTFLVHVWRKCRGADCFCWQIIFLPRRTLICFARSVPLGRSLNTIAFADNSFDTRSAALHYCTQTVSGTVCLVYRYLFRINYSAFCTRCSEFWNSVREKHNKVLLATRNLTLFFWTERGRAIVNRSHSESWKSLSKWCSCNFSNNGKKCSNNERKCSNNENKGRPKNSGSAPKLNLKNNDSESKQKDNRRTWRPCFNSLRSPLSRDRSSRRRPLQSLQFFRPLTLLRSCRRIIGRGFSSLRELMLSQMTERHRFFSPTSCRWCTSYFQTLLHKQRRRGKSTMLR